MQIRKQPVGGGWRNAVRLDVTDGDLLDRLAAVSTPSPDLSSLAKDMAAESLEATRLAAQADRDLAVAREHLAKLERSREPAGLTMRLAEAHRAVAVAEADAKAIGAAAATVQGLAAKVAADAESSSLRACADFINAACAKANGNPMTRVITPAMRALEVKRAMEEELGPLGPEFHGAISSTNASELFIDDPTGRPLAVLRRTAGAFYS